MKARKDRLSHRFLVLTPGDRRDADLFSRRRTTAKWKPEFWVRNAEADLNLIRCG